MPLSEEKINVLRELGQEIQTRRAELGFTLDDIYQRTRIQPSYIDAIEEAEYENLPGAVYTLGFIRTYLGILQFDELYPEFRHWLLKNTRTVGTSTVVGSYEPPTPGFKLASRFWVFVVLLLMVFGAMTYAAVKLANDGISRLVGDPGTGGSGQPALAVSADSSGDASADIPSPTPAPTPAPTQPPAKPELKLVAADDCWISIRVGNGKIADRTLKKGETYTMPLTERTRVNYGRPWVITVIHNGKDIGTPYKSGVKRPQVNFYDPDGKSGRIEARQRSDRP